MGKNFRVFVKTPEGMVRLGAHIGRYLTGGSVIGLIGPLGAGKTTIARGIAEGMGIREGFVVSSPTYTIMQVYPCLELELCHLDLYRISGHDDLDSTGYRDACSKEKVLVVEWPDREPSVLPEKHLQICIEYAGDGRDVSILANDGGYEKLLEEITGSEAWNFVPNSMDLLKETI